MNKKTAPGIFAVLAVLALCFTADAEILGDYVGYKACIDCHEEIVDGWKTTSHAHAFETLREQGEEKQSIPGCVKCHVVGFETDGGFVDMTLTPELADVQCENCHGPARKHVESDGDPGLIIMKPDEASCRICHTEGQDKNFDFETKKQWVHASAEQAVKSDQEISRPGKVLTLSDTRVAFGSMVEGDVVKKEVILTNTGKETVTLTNVTTS